jgi:hypothetical protein
MGTMAAWGSAEQISAGAMGALRDGMRKMRQREWRDREGAKQSVPEEDAIP